MSEQLDFKSVLVALMPEGELWNPRSGGGFDLWLEAKAENIKDIYDRLAAAAYVRDPRRTNMLEDLEKEYRTIPGAVLTEDERRIQLANIKYAPVGTGSADYLQARLQENGFNLVVRENSPAIDPRIFAEISYLMMADGGASFAGNQTAFAGVFGGEVIVNQNFRDQDIAYEAQANGAETFAGNEIAIAGYFDNIKNYLIEYSLAMHYGYWSCVFFVAGGFSGWDPLKDWNMEKPGNVDWLAGSSSQADKDIFALIADQDDLVAEFIMQTSSEDKYKTIYDTQDYAIGENFGGVNSEDRQGLELSYDGSSQYSIYEFPYKGYTSGTFEAIARMDGYSTYFIPIFGHNGSESYHTGIQTEQGKICAAFGWGVGQHSESPGFEFSDDEYYHIVATWENGGSARLFVNGKAYDNGVVGLSTYFRLANYKVSPDVDWSLHTAWTNLASDLYLACEVAYCSFYDTKKSDDWCLSRYFNLMRYGARRLRVSAKNNTNIQQLTPYPYDTSILNDYIMYLDPIDIVGKYDQKHLASANATEILTDYGRALSFNGTNSTCGGSSIMHRRTEFSVEVFVRINNSTSDTMIVGSLYGAGDANPLWGIFVNSDSDVDGDVSLFARITIDDFPNITAMTPDTTTLGDWHHIFMTWKSGEPIKLYINGVLEAQSDVVTGISDRGATWPHYTIGVGYDPQNLTYLDGDIHRLVFYSERKELAYIQARYNEMSGNLTGKKVSDINMAPLGKDYGDDYNLHDTTRNQNGKIGGGEYIFSKYGRSISLRNARYIDLGTNHPFMAISNHTVIAVVEKSTTTPTVQAVVSNGSTLSTDRVHLVIDYTNYPSTVDVRYEWSDNLGNPRSHSATAAGSIFDSPVHIVARRAYTTSTTLSLFINGVETSAGYPNQPVVTNVACRIGDRPTSDYFVGKIHQVKLYAYDVGTADITADYNDFEITDMEGGSYAEQILETSLTTGLEGCKAYFAGRYYYGSGGDEFDLQGNEFNSDELTIELPFYPVFDWDENSIRTFIDSSSGNRYSIYKHDNANNNAIVVFLGNSMVFNIIGSVYSSYWRPGSRNLLVITSDGINNYCYLNNNLIASNTTAWSKKDPSSFFIGKNESGTSIFWGTISYVKIYHRLMSEEEIYDLWNNLITSSIEISGVAWGDGSDASPYVMVQNPTTLEWETIWMGINDSDIQHFTATAENGLSAIRLYNGLSSDGIVYWDDIQLIDPQVIRGQVVASRKERLKQLILRHKPMGSWCVLVTDYV